MDAEEVTRCKVRHYVRQVKARKSKARRRCQQNESAIIWIVKGKAMQCKARQDKARGGLRQRKESKVKKLKTQTDNH